MAQVLRHLPKQTHPDLIVGTDTFDDAGVFRLHDELALVQTVDFFPPLVDDAFDFGRIAAANALSDVYAMGGQPLTCLNIVGFPDKDLPADVLVEILRGGAETVRQAGAVIIGGHSVRDAEIKYGLSVTGVVHPDRVWTNAGARPGDVLVLTKPLGSGVLCSAAKSGKLPESDVADAVAVMAMLNRSARDAGVAVGGVHACTDITGFGLVGHAFEMADGSDVTITLSASAVPLLPHTVEMARLGVLTRASKTTREHLGGKLVVDNGVEEALAGVLMDAQTSGGLLFAVDPDRADSMIDALQAAKTACAAAVGSVAAPGPVRVHVVA